ncbi:hypothetical protein Tco_1439475 [Tanacetum coccineum]
MLIQLGPQPNFGETESPNSPNDDCFSNRQRRTGHALGSGLRRFKNFMTGNLSKLLNLWKSSSVQSDSGNDIRSFHGLWSLCYGRQCESHESYYVEVLAHLYSSVGNFVDSDLDSGPLESILALSVPSVFLMTPGTTQIRARSPPIRLDGDVISTMLMKHLEQSRGNEPVSSATEINAQVVPQDTSLSTTIAQDARQTSVIVQHPIFIFQYDIKNYRRNPFHEDTPNHSRCDSIPSHNHVCWNPGFAQTSFGECNSAETNQRNQLASDALWFS